MSGQLARKAAVVTGAARGIGRAVMRAFAAEGAIVHAIDMRGDELDAAARDAAAPVATHALDLADADAVAACFAAIEAREGRIDVLVSNAGIIFYKPVEAVSVAEWDRLIAVNLRATFLCAKAVAPGMKRRRAGSIINVSSNAGLRGGVDETTYCASKFGVEGFSRALALECGPYNIAVNTITPGHPVHTAMSETTYGPAQRAIWRDPAEIAPAFVHLARQDASGLTDRHVRAWDLTQELKKGAATAVLTA